MKKFGLFFIWRRVRDLDPRYIAVHQFSRLTHSTTLTTLHIKITNNNFMAYYKEFFLPIVVECKHSVPGPSRKPRLQKSTGLLLPGPSRKPR